MELALERIVLPLAVEWKIARNTSVEKTNFILRLRDGERETLGEVAPNIRYGETPEIIEAEFAEFKALAAKGYEAALNAKAWKHSLRFALEAAWLSWLAQSKGQRLYQYLGAKTRPAISTSISVPIMAPAEVAAYLAPLGRFDAVKVKVTQEGALELIRAVHRAAPTKKLRIDGNEGFTDLHEYLALEAAIKDLPVEFVEQPFAAASKEMYRELHKHTRFCIMADESIEDQDNIAELATMFGAVNIKLMKTGGLLRARDLLIKARAFGLKTMVGCMIETGLGISYALELSEWMDWADLDGNLLLKKDPFPLVREREGILESLVV